jgi:hypothetical protein
VVYSTHEESNVENIDLIVRIYKECALWKEDMQIKLKVNIIKKG